jgi:hypothetical protein
MFRTRTIIILLTLLVIGGGGGFAAWYFLHEEEERGVGPRIEGPDEYYSNILPADYVGPKACGECHPKQHRLWSGHPHRFMNQLPGKDSVKGDFADHVWTIAPGYTVTFTTEGGDFLMTVERPGKHRVQYKVTRTIGSRFMQFYVGVQTDGPEPAGDKLYTTEHRLPFAYWFRMKRWMPNDYFDVGDDWSESLVDGRPEVDGVDAKPNFNVFTENCLHCHNTYPHAYRIWRKTLRGFPGAVMTPDRDALRAALPARAQKSEVFEDLPHTIDAHKDLITVGISCESCHMGGREHAIEKKKISFFPTSPHVTMTSKTLDRPFTGKRRNPVTSQGVCAQCHSAATVVAHPNGARIRNSSESIDMLQGACSSQITCVTCHEPHTAGVPSGGPTLPEYVEACVKCHEKFGTEQQQAAHSRHSNKVDCLDCHMPRLNQGIDEISRTHRICLPVEQSMISKGAPNACNLCHLDKTVRWTMDELRKGWQQDMQPLKDTKPEFLDAPAGKTWLKGPTLINRMVALDAYSRSPLWKSNIPEIAETLNDANPTRRAFALIGIERMLGRPVGVREIDIMAGPAQRQKQIDQFRPTLEKHK